MEDIPECNAHHPGFYTLSNTTLKSDELDGSGRLYGNIATNVLATGYVAIKDLLHQNYKRMISNSTL